MIPEAQRIEIAKACGWTKFEPDTIQYTARRSDGKWGVIPDYPKDLNDMHEAEKFLTTGNLITYERHLSMAYQKITGSWTMYRATAAQRAEAFLKTLNKWEEQS